MTDDNYNYEDNIHVFSLATTTTTTTYYIIYILLLLLFDAGCLNPLNKDTKFLKKNEE